MPAIVNSFISLLGQPITGATPTIRIWEITDTANDLVVEDENMQEVIDTSSPSGGDGFYKYIFNSYDETKEYLVRVDAGASIPIHSRYYVGELEKCCAPTVGDIRTELENELAMLKEVWRMYGLDPSNPLVVSETQRVVGLLTQAITDNPATCETTVTRTSALPPEITDP
jgi:hypothetical protein